MERPFVTPQGKYQDDNIQGVPNDQFVLKKRSSPYAVIEGQNLQIQGENVTIQGEEVVF